VFGGGRGGSTVTPFLGQSRETFCRKGGGGPLGHRYYRRGKPRRSMASKEVGFAEGISLGGGGWRGGSPQGVGEESVSEPSA